MSKDLMDDLIKLLPPLQKPIDLEEYLMAANRKALGTAYPKDDLMLKMNQQALGIDFPTDFVRFGTVFGSGVVRTHFKTKDGDGCYSWDVCSPFSPLFCQLVIRCARTLRCVQGLPRISGSEYAELSSVSGKPRLVAIRQHKPGRLGLLVNERRAE